MVDFDTADRYTVGEFLGILIRLGANTTTLKNVNKLLHPQLQTVKLKPEEVNTPW